MQHVNLKYKVVKTKTGGGDNNMFLNIKPLNINA
jgi:hypothetical protein